MNIDTAISTWLLNLRAENKSPRTLAWYGHKLRYFAAWLSDESVASVDDLQPGHLKRFLHRLGGLERTMDDARGFKAKRPSSLTIHGYAQVIRTFGRWLARMEYLTRDPFDGVRLPKVEQYVVTAFTADDLRKMLVAAKRGRNADRNFTVIMVLYDTAIRAGELASLKISQIDLEGGWLQVDGKGNKQRLVPRWLPGGRPA